MSFSHWMAELREQERASLPVQASPISMSSSWAETDSDSDSDGEYGLLEHKTKMAHKSRNFKQPRTAPILIPVSSRRQPSRSHFSHVETPCEDELEVEDELDLHRDQTLDIDDEDLLLFGNVAFFQRQHKSRETSRRRSSNSSTHAFDADEEIFSMEL